MVRNCVIVAFEERIEKVAVEEKGSGMACFEGCGIRWDFIDVVA